MSAEKNAEQMAEIIEKYVAKAVAQLAESIGELKKSLSELPVAKDGIDGKNGIDGINGKDVSPEEVSNMVIAAVSKVMTSIKKPKDGNDGRDGRDGKDGTDGRDAGDIEFLPSINPEKSYPKGTYACHFGGLWKAKRATEGMDGWENIVVGIKDFKIEKTAERSYSAVFEKSSGEVQKIDFKVAGMKYQGVYREQEYQEGDTVTWAGSLWHCDKSTKEKPGASECWTLAAKRGADAKPVVKIEDKK